MCIHNPTSRAWEQLLSLTDLPADDLKKYGIAGSYAPSPVERHLSGAQGYSLVLKMEDNDISASIVNESVPEGKLPRKRLFTVEGDADHPVLVEIRANSRAASEVFDELIFWLRNVASKNVL